MRRRRLADEARFVTPRGGIPQPCCAAMYTRASRAAACCWYWGLGAARSPPGPFLTVDDVAEMLQLNRHAVRNYIDPGELAAVRVGKRRIRIRRSAVEAFLAAVETGDELGIAPMDDPETAGSQEIPDLPADGRERFASAVGESAAARDSGDRAKRARALGRLAGGARELAVALANTHGGE